MLIKTTKAMQLKNEARSVLALPEKTIYYFNDGRKMEWRKKEKRFRLWTKTC